VIAPIERLGRLEFTLMLSAMMALTALGIDLMLPAFDEMRADLDLESDPTAISATVTAYFLGMAVGQLFYGALADRLGRRPSLYTGLAVYGLGAVASAISPSLGALIIARLVWGFGSAGSRVIAVTLVRDRYRGAQMAQAMSYVMSIFIMVPVFAPTLGAGIAAVAGWRWIFWTCAVLAVGLAIWAMRLPETLRAEDRMAVGVASVGRAMKRVLTTRTSGGYLVAMSFMMGVFMSYLASSELIIGDIFGYDDQFPLVFGVIALVLAAGAFLNARVVVRFGLRNVVTASWLSYLLSSVALLLVTLANDGVPPFGAFLVCLGLVLGSHMLVFPNLNTLAMEPLGDIAGTGAAVLGFVSMGTGALLGAVIDRGIETTVTALALAFVVAAAASGAAIAWVRRGDLVESDSNAAVMAALEGN
jgi:DHA1 family bicyclomycin/chloramphenicol resistance-like MFS transporter